MRTKVKRVKKLSRTDELNTMIRAAALTIDPKGSINKLAERAGVNGESIRGSIRRGKFSVGLACALECAVGRQHLQREVLCPLLKVSQGEDVGSAVLAG